MRAHDPVCAPHHFLRDANAVGMIAYSPDITRLVRTNSTVKVTEQISRGTALIDDERKRTVHLRSPLAPQLFMMAFW